MPTKIFKFFSSLRLTVACLGFALLLVFFGTLAQVNEGLYEAQSQWFKSFFVWWGPHGAGWKMPVYPGGYLIGTVLLLNLVAAHIQRFQFTWKKLGIHLAHAGIILLLVGQLATDMLARETDLTLMKGETKRYSESPRRAEIAFLTDAAFTGQDEVVAIPESYLQPGRQINQQELPFAVRIKEYHPNAEVRQRAPMMDSGPPPATQGVGPNATMIPAEVTHEQDKRNIPAAVVELIAPQGSLGTWLVAPDAIGEQPISVGGKIWRIAMRWERHYFPYSVQLLNTKYEIYPGTDIPKNYQSRVRIENPSKGESREVNIYMNNPLRYEGQTFYQSGMGETMDEASRQSTLQVVKNPGWLTPYFGCILVAAGMAYQFLLHLTGFVSKRRNA